MSVKPGLIWKVPITLYMLNVKTVQEKYDGVSMAPGTPETKEKHLPELRWDHFASKGNFHTYG